MYHRNRLLPPIFLLSGIFSNAVWAGICDSEVQQQQWLKKQGYQQQKILTDCRVWPAEENTSLMAVAVLDAEAGEEWIGGYVLHLFKLQSQDGKVVDQYKQADYFPTDAIRVDKISLDTAPYRVKPEIRAIGVRVNYEGASRVFPYSSQTLNLYDLKNKQTLLDGLVVELYRGKNGTSCNSEWEEHKAIVLLPGTSTQGYADLKIKLNIHYEGMEMYQDECADLPQRQKNTSFVVKFDGQAYRIPDGSKGSYYYGK